MDWSPKPQETLCGQHEAGRRTYKKYVGKSGRIWLVPTERGCASEIHVSGGPDSDGYGGATLTFLLEDGTKLDLKGPWHSNSDALFADTGVDVRDCHFTFGCIAHGRKYEGMKLTMLGVIHLDKEPVLGNFDRIERMAQEIADKTNETVYYYSQSPGGSVCSAVKPGQGRDKNTAYVCDLSPHQQGIVQA